MNKLMRAGVVGGVVTCLVLASGGTANAAQGGFDRSGAATNYHSWMKVSAAELRTKTADRACTDIFGTSSRECDHLVVGVVQQKMWNPNAAGYWAEHYYNTGKLRSGTW